MRRSGFNHLQNFVGRFKQKTGATPGAYRRRFAAEQS